MSEMKPMAWLADDGCGLLMATIDKSSAYEVCASEIGVGLVSPLYTADQLADAVAAEREKNATYLNAFWAAASLDGEEVVVTIKLRALFIMDEKVKDTIRRVLNGSAAK